MVLTDDLEARLLTDPEELRRLEPEWKSLWERSPQATPFHSPEWLREWWAHYGEGELHTWVFRSRGELAGIAPLRFPGRGFAPAPRKAGPCSNPHDP